MATVAELKTQCDDMGISYNSRTRKLELEQLIAAHQVSTTEPVESVTEDQTMPTRQTPEERALAARVAGGMGESAEPMSNARRCETYSAQRGDVGHQEERYTPRQQRRIRKRIRRNAPASV